MAKIPNKPLTCPACGAGPYWSVGDLQAHISSAHPTPK
jgi:hypothetical protein